MIVGVNVETVSNVPGHLIVTWLVMSTFVRRSTTTLTTLLGSVTNIPICPGVIARTRK